MKLKKILFISSIITIFLSIILLLFININITLNINNNKKVISIFNTIFKENNLTLYEEDKTNIPKFQIENTDYIGLINIPKTNLSLPIKSKCANTYFNIDSACNYNNKSFIIIGTNLKDSFYNINSYTVNDLISFTNSLGQIYHYKIIKIKRISNLKELSKYNEDLIIAIKNYYNMEYILLMCSNP